MLEAAPSGPGRDLAGVVFVIVEEPDTCAVARYNVKAAGHVAKLRRDLSV
jgi:hypothetical protein